MPNRVSRLRRSSCWGKAWLLGLTLYWWGPAPQQQQHYSGVLAFVSNPSRLVHSQATVLSQPNAPRRTFFPASTPRRICQQLPKGQQKQHQQSSTQLHFMGSDGGFLGIGTPELVRNRWRDDRRNRGFWNAVPLFWFVFHIPMHHKVGLSATVLCSLPSYTHIFLSFSSLLFFWWGILSWDRQICTNS